MDPYNQTVQQSSLSQAGGFLDPSETQYWLSVLISRIRDSADPNTRLALEELQRLQLFVPLQEIDHSSYINLVKLCHECQQRQAVTHKEGRFYCEECVPIYECMCKQNIPNDQGFCCLECGFRACWRCFISRNSRGESQCLSCRRGSLSTTTCPLCTLQVPVSDVYFQVCEANHVACKTCATLCKLEGKCLLDGHQYAQQELVCKTCDKHLDLTVVCECCEKTGTKYVGRRKCLEDCQVCFDCQGTFSLKCLQEGKPTSCVCCAELIE